ncbi:hypothetical protein F0521_14480 [Ferrimonas sp. YFM]|nr:hypothetical protein F0521_14480 [Ferrimonas sp. YFM]
MHTVPGCRLTPLFALFSLTLVGGCQHQSTAPEPDAEPTKQSVLPFAWPFETPESMLARGGSSQGSQVTLAAGESPL